MGSFEIYKNQIIIVKVNEEVTSASGCSIDKLTHFIKQIEKVENRLKDKYPKVATKTKKHAKNIDKSTT